jgi:hypothetical protein
MAKVVAVSTDDLTYNTLPGSSGELSRDGAVIDDTIFGEAYKSGMTGILQWTVNANAVYKGYAGYLAKLKKMGTSTVMTTEACALVSGKTYQISNSAKRIWDRSAVVTVFDNAVDHTSDVEAVDYLFGTITFKATYTVTGAVTITGKYFPTADLAKWQSYTLTQTAEAIKDTDGPTAQANGGYNTNSPGLKTVTLEVPSVYDRTAAWAIELINRREVLIEINPDGNAKSIARGFFRLTADKQSGNVGALEQETLSFTLNVPLSSGAAGFPSVDRPFGWSHAVDSPIPTAVKNCLNAWENETEIYVRYLPDAVNGIKGLAVVTNMTLTGGMEAPSSFAVTLLGDGGLTDIGLSS